MLSFPYEDIEYKKKKQILFCGRFNMQKNPYRALYAWQKLQDRLSDWKLLMVGDGPLLPRCIEFAKELNLKRVEFVGFQNPQQLYKESPLLWMTSNYEGWGLVLTEAMQYKCVPVAFDSFEAIADIITDGHDGCLVEPFDIKNFAETTLQLVSSRKLSQICLYTNIKVKYFETSAIGAEWKLLFKDLIIE